MKQNQIKKALPVLLLIVITQALGMLYQINTPRRLTVVVMLLLLIAAAVSVFIAGKTDWVRAALVFLFLTAFIIRADYIIYTPTWIRQHDVIGFGAGFGQAGFIEYFYNNFKLIDFDPREYWGFFQPPLHHMLAAVWLHMQTAVGNVLGWSYDQACENVQLLTLIYSMLIGIYGYRILKRLNYSGGILVTGTALIVLHPCFIQMSGSINNDILCVLLQIMAVFYFLEWMETESWRSIVLTALFMGLSMMAKLSGILLAPAIALVLCVRLWKGIKSSDRSELIRLIKQYVVFGLISVPIGIWSPVRNLIKFGVPLNFTPKVGESVDNVSLLNRILYPGNEITPFTCLKANGNGYDEFNVPLAILKTSLFGEADFSVCTPLSVFMGWVLLIAGALLAAVIFAVALRMLVLWIKRGELSYIFMVVYIAVSLSFLLNLCFSIPNFSSEDFRYISHIIIPEAVILCEYMRENNKGFVNKLIKVVTAVFCFSSVMTYLMAGYILW